MINLPDSVENIGDNAFVFCKVPCFRIPPLVSKVNEYTFRLCNSMCSLVVPASLEQMTLGNDHRYLFPRSLRNVTVPQNSNGSILISGGSDLRRVFLSPNSSDVTRALERRFDGLPIHEKCYYQSYYLTEDVLSDLERIIDPRAQQSRRLRSKLNVTGNTQDCLGMTPLHILACSTKHDVRLYQLLIEKYPDNLIAKDKWGDIPLLYAGAMHLPRSCSF